MKITAEPGKLRLEVYSRFLFRFWGLVFILAGFVFLLPLLVQYHLSCEDKGYNKANACTLNMSFLRLYNQTTDLGELKSATVSNVMVGRSNTIFYCLLLNSSEGYIKVPGIKSKRTTDIDYVVDLVNNYIKTSLAKSIKLPKIDDWLANLKVIIFLLLGLGSLLFRLVTIHFSEKTKTLRIVAKNILNAHETKIPLAEVQKLIIEEQGKHHKEYSLSLILKGGELVHLPGLHDSSLQQIEKIAQQIRPFINRS